jgi:trans-2,3-dihydro-3-hydroxyanthranilate isomerase
MRYFIVDVFTDRKYAGNSLAVVETPKALSKARMQAIAAEFNLSETTFVIGGVDAKDIKGVKGAKGAIDVRSGKTLAKVPSQLHAPVRIFTPQAEVPFAGHPTLGTAHVIARHLHPSPSRAKPKLGTDTTGILPDVTLHLKAGAVPVRFDARSGLWWLTAPQPVFGPEHRDGQTTQAPPSAPNGTSGGHRPNPGASARRHRSRFSGARGFNRYRLFSCTAQKPSGRAKSKR